ncbi:MAG: hypothetical protein OXT65_00680 [Alphaproteobacteria bacterium]|nr:hypothetical protein [Alphaproteobacteria bacterium]
MSDSPSKTIDDVRNKLLQAFDRVHGRMMLEYTAGLPSYNDYAETEELALRAKALERVTKALVAVEAEERQQDEANGPKKARLGLNKL